MNNKRIIKIVFDIKYRNLLKFVEKSIYMFQCKLTNENLTLEYVGKSRIDGYDLFSLDMTVNLRSKLTDFEFNNIKIKEVSLISNLEDHSLEYGTIADNQRKINEFLNEYFKINKYDLTTRDAHISVIRDLKMKFILDEDKKSTS